MPTLADVPAPSVDAKAPLTLIRRCPVYARTPLTQSADLAQAADVGAIHIKDERGRMGLGSFKALGAAYVIAHDAGQGDVSGTTYVTASAGNHGMSVAAGAAAFGARAVVFIAETVPESFAERLRAQGADVVRSGATYEESMTAAAQTAQDNGWVLLSDSSWPGYFDRPYRVMEGYLVLMAEIVDQIEQPPTHVFVQAGVGGLAGAVAALSRQAWGRAPIIVVVEPDAAPALMASIDAGKSVISQGPVSKMGRLDCKEPSLIALKGLARDADFFITITEEEGQKGADIAKKHGFSSTPSGAAGIAGLLAAGSQQGDLGLTENSRVLVILSEGPEA